MDFLGDEKGWAYLPNRPPSFFGPELVDGLISDGLDSTGLASGSFSFSFSRTGPGTTAGSEEMMGPGSAATASENAERVSVGATGGISSSLGKAVSGLGEGERLRRPARKPPFLEGDLLSSVGLMGLSVFWSSWMGVSLSCVVVVVAAGMVSMASAAAVLCSAASSWMA